METELEIFLADEDEVLEVLRESIFGERVRFDCFCGTCGDVVAEAEADADWVGGRAGSIVCEHCGPGTRIASGLIFAGMI